MPAPLSQYLHRWFKRYIENGLSGREAACRLLISIVFQPSSFLDNLSVHRNIRAAQALRNRRCWLLYLPPCSPDLNPVEMAFAGLKSLLRKAGARTYDQLTDALGRICDLFSSEECWNYLRHAGYRPGQAWWRRVEALELG